MCVPVCICEKERELKGDDRERTSLSVYKYFHCTSVNVCVSMNVCIIDREVTACFSAYTQCEYVWH